VDIEFTGNFSSNGNFRINLVQCRPFQVKVKGEGSRVRLPETIEEEHLLFESTGPIVGHSVVSAVDRVIYVVPSVYGQMSISQRYSVARTIGRLMHLDETPDQRTTMLIGPGRWGTSMPWLGVPVSFAEISKASIICELAVMHQGLIPEVSLGTHFFNDLVEMDILYLAITPGKQAHSMNEQFLRQRPNQLVNLLPSAREWTAALWVVDPRLDRERSALFLNVDSMQQRAVCYTGQKDGG
jgi:pyruvate, water dikinase